MYIRYPLEGELSIPSSTGSRESLVRREEGFEAFNVLFEPRSPELARHSPEGMRSEEQGMPFEEVFKRREEEGTGLEAELAARELRGTRL